MLTEHTLNRLKAINNARDTILTDTEMGWLKTAVILSNRGTGTESPNLDILCITAPVQKVSACRSPAWIPLRCHHGNETWKLVRCRKCVGCHHAWRSKVRALILNGLIGRNAYMWTLTIPEYPSQMEGDRFDVAQERWHNLLRDAGKRGFRFEYMRVVEMQKRGTPHFHIAVKMGSGQVSNTKALARRFRGLAKRARFGYREGKTTDFQSASLGGAGVASYMSKYLVKSEDFYALRREDGRAIRRYCRSRGWSNPRTPAVWRYARNGPITRLAQSDADVLCSCGDHEILNREAQVARWLAANRRAGEWVAPLGVADYIFEEGVK